MLYNIVTFMKNRQILFFGAIILITVVIVFLLNNKKTKKITSLLNPTISITENKGLSIGEDICTEFPKEWTGSVLNKPITKTERLNSSGTHVCQYYFDNTNFVTLRLNNLSAENQKKGQITLGRTITTNEKIQMDHFIVQQENGLINNTVLILNPNLFLAVDRSSTKAASEEEIINFASAVSNRILKGDFKTSLVTPTENKNNTVPLPQETDIVRSFFEIIGEHRPSDAVMMMTPINTNNDSIKQAWAVQFNAFKSMKIISVEPSMQSDWTENIHSYKITLQVEMKPEAASAQPMPNYGWDDGENIRWIQIEKINGKWMIGGIGTGP